MITVALMYCYTTKIHQQSLEYTTIIYASCKGNGKGLIHGCLPSIIFYVYGTLNSSTGNTPMMMQ